MPLENAPRNKIEKQISLDVIERACLCGTIMIFASYHARGVGALLVDWSAAGLQKSVHLKHGLNVGLRELLVSREVLDRAGQFPIFQVSPQNPGNFRGARNWTVPTTLATLFPNVYV